MNQMGETSEQFTVQANREMKVKLTYPGDENKPVTEEATLMLKYR